MPAHDSHRPALTHQQPGGGALPLYLLLPTLFAAVVFSHWALLRLPYWWDEAGYYIPAAWDFFRTGSLIPYSTLSNAHPPLPSVYLAVWWKLFGFTPLITRLAMCLAAALALSGVHRLAWILAAQGLKDAERRRFALWAVGLTAVYPVWFAQSTLAHADLLAATGTLWGLCFYFASTDRENRDTRCLLAALGCFSLAALAKEIAVGTPLALAAWEALLALHSRRHFQRERREVQPASHLRLSATLLTPAIPLALWFAYHRWRTGFTFGNPEYLRYNATATLEPTRIALALLQRTLHLTAHLGLFIPVLLAFGAQALQPVRPQAVIAKAQHHRLLVILLANWVFFSILGGALLTRYLLPLYPLVILLCLAALYRRLRNPGLAAALTALAFVLSLCVNPPYRFAPEDTLAYADSIRLQQDAIAVIGQRFGHHAPILTAWPATDALSKPELGYVQQPFPVVAIDNFSLSEVQCATALEQQGSSYSVALIFSTKYDPQHSLPAMLLGSLGRREQQLNEHYFGFHYDLPPDVVAHLLGGEIVWREERAGQWAAVIRFNRPVAA